MFQVKQWRAMYTWSFQKEFHDIYNFWRAITTSTEVQWTPRADTAVC